MRTFQVRKMAEFCAWLRDHVLPGTRAKRIEFKILGRVLKELLLADEGDWTLLDMVLAQVLAACRGQNRGRPECFVVLAKALHGATPAIQDDVLFRSQYAKTLTKLHADGHSRSAEAVLHTVLDRMALCKTEFSEDCVTLALQLRAKMSTRRMLSHLPLTPFTAQAMVRHCHSARDYTADNMDFVRRALAADILQPELGVVKAFSADRYYCAPFQSEYVQWVRRNFSRWHVNCSPKDRAQGAVLWWMVSVLRFDVLNLELAEDREFLQMCLRTVVDNCDPEWSGSHALYKFSMLEFDSHLHSLKAQINLSHLLVQPQVLAPVVAVYNEARARIALWYEFMSTFCYREIVPYILKSPYRHDPVVGPQLVKDLLVYCPSHCWKRENLNNLSAFIGAEEAQSAGHSVWSRAEEPMLAECLEVFFIKHAHASELEVGAWWRRAERRRVRRLWMYGVIAGRKIT